MKNREKDILENTIKRCREKNIIIPTYQQMRNPALIPDKIKEKLKTVGLWDINPLNLFRITWHNEPKAKGGGFNGVNFMEIPQELSGIKARIFVLIGKYFPTGAHKVGASFGPLVEKLVTGKFDPTTQKALWPSTGNYCRGGAFNSSLLGCEAIALLPEEMSQERFDWLKKIGAEVYATPGSESNVKEIYDKAKELISNNPDSIVNMNQFEEFGNPRWHYHVTGPAMEEVFRKNTKPGQRFSGIFSNQGSAGALASGDYIRTIFPKVKVCAGEAKQCPTLLYNGYGVHRIEGIGDKHVPWVLDVKNLDMVAGVDDNVVISIMRLFNEPEGIKYLKLKGIDENTISKLNLLGISSIANIIGAIKMAKWYEFNENDCLFTIATDSMEMYGSRLDEEKLKHGQYSERQAAIDFEGKWMEISTDYVLEPNYYDKKRMHNLKYFTWVEQQGKTVEELNEQWYSESYWKNHFAEISKWDKMINEFNDKVGLINNL